jgi:hypothetical protein
MVDCGTLSGVAVYHAPHLWQAWFREVFPDREARSFIVVNMGLDHGWVLELHGGEA